MQPEFDVVIIGGGPAGSTAALCLARKGARVIVIEKAAFPRFQIGESFLPYNFELLRKLGLLERVQALPHIQKLGAEFGMGQAVDTSQFHFSIGLTGGENETLNVVRADFDNALLDAAQDAGAQVLQPATVKRIEQLNEQGVVLATEDRQITARFVLDASGQATMIGRHLKLRQDLDDPHLRKIAYFGHFTKVDRLPGKMAGYPTVAMFDEGWFWMIPLDEERTSVGLVLDPDAAKRVDVPAREMLAWAIERCPLVKSRMAHAVGEQTNMVRADFSYRCTPVAGPGYFLLGDAAVFLDPVFSSGVCLGMAHGVEAADRVADVLEGRATPAAAAAKYRRYVASSSRWFAKLIRYYYDHAFRELFLQGQGPLRVHAAVLAILTGHVFPRPSFAVRWRFYLFELIVRLHRRIAIVPRRERFSLLAGADSTAASAPAAATVLSESGDAADTQADAVR